MESAIRQWEAQWRRSKRAVWASGKTAKASNSGKALATRSDVVNWLQKLPSPMGAPKRLKVPVWLRGMPGGKRLMSTVAAAPPHATSSSPPRAMRRCNAWSCTFCHATWWGSKESRRKWTVRSMCHDRRWSHLWRRRRMSDLGATTWSGSRWLPHPVHPATTRRFSWCQRRKRSWRPGWKGSDSTKKGKEEAKKDHTVQHIRDLDNSKRDIELHTTCAGDIDQQLQDRMVWLFFMLSCRWTKRVKRRSVLWSSRGVELPQSWRSEEMLWRFENYETTSFACLSSVWAVQHLASNQQRSMRSRAEKKKAHWDVLLHFAIQLCQEQMKMGGTFSLEHPVQAESWENSKLQHLMDAAGVEAVVFYQSLV